jgi:cell division protein FtsI/penicillin-binding protein 2
MRYSCHDWQRRSAVPPPPYPQAISPRRQWVLGGALALALVGLAARLAYWQLGQGDALAAEAGAESQHDAITIFDRGTIRDRNGVILALTITGNAIIADPLAMQQANRQHPGTLDRAVDQLASITGVAPDVLSRQLMQATRYRMLDDASGMPIHLESAAGDTVQRAIAAGDLPGVRLQPLSWRVEPSGSLAGQVLGFVRASDGIGQYGIEQQENTLLAGIPNYLYPAGQQQQAPAVPGADITLTLDANIQLMAEQGLRTAVADTGATGGTVIIADPLTGAILALANAPDFDPNHYNAAPLATYPDPAVAGVYDPGSTMKAVTMAMGIDSGAITPDTTIDDPGYFVAGKQTIYNWNHQAFGRETMTQVLAHSANAGAAWVAVDAVGHDRFYRYLNTFGFGTPTGVDLPGEAAGIMPPPTASADDATLNLAENAFGESIAVTPLQMAMAYGALANGGELMRPMIVASVTRDGQTRQLAPTAVRSVVTPQTAATVTQMLVASGLRGEAQTGLVKGYAVAAKTGTSTPDPSQPSQTYASVIGYAPASQPQFVVLVKLDHPQTDIFGGGAAGPLWRSLVRQLMAYAHVPAEGGIQNAS